MSLIGVFHFHIPFIKTKWKKQSPEIRFVILKCFWQPATMLPTWNEMLALFMNIKCHHFPLHQIISGDRTISVEGERVFVHVHSPPPLPSPRQPFHLSPWLCVKFSSLGRTQVHLIMFQVSLQVSDQVAWWGCQVCSKPKGTLSNVKSLGSQLIFFFFKFSFPCFLKKSIIRGKSAGVERKRHCPSGSLIYLLIDGWEAGTQLMRGMNKIHVLGIISVRQWKPATQEYLANV